MLQGQVLISPHRACAPTLMSARMPRSLRLPVLGLADLSELGLEPLMRLENPVAATQVLAGLGSRHNLFPAACCGPNPIFA